MSSLSENPLLTECISLFAHKNASELFPKRLSELSNFDYESIRQDLAKATKWRTDKLDEARESLRESRKPERAKPGTPTKPEDLEPYSGKIDGNELLNDIVAILNKHVIIPRQMEYALAVFFLGTYLFNIFQIWPRLLIYSPVKRCGKTTLLNIAVKLVNRGDPSSSTTAAVIYREIGLFDPPPTYCFDEIDAYLPNNESLRLVINSSHEKDGARVKRCDGEDNIPTYFSTWAPMILAGIAQPADTIVDRSLAIHMRRRMPHEKIEKTPYDFSDICKPIRQKLLKFANDEQKNIKERYYEIRAGKAKSLRNLGNDRAQDNWQPIAAIADIVGGEWPAHIKTAYEIAMAEESGDDDRVTWLLEDIRTVVDNTRKQEGRRAGSGIWSQELVDKLLNLEGNPYHEWTYRDGPLNQEALAESLKPFNARPVMIKKQGKGLRGYKFDRLYDIFRHYIPMDEERKKKHINAIPNKKIVTELHPASGSTSNKKKDFQAPKRDGKPTKINRTMARWLRKAAKAENIDPEQALTEAAQHPDINGWKVSQVYKFVEMLHERKFS